jgi:hypothetical protein
MFERIDASPGADLLRGILSSVILNREICQGPAAIIYWLLFIPMIPFGQTLSFRCDPNWVEWYRSAVGCTAPADRIDYAERLARCGAMM